MSPNNCQNFARIGYLCVFLPPERYKLIFKCCFMFLCSLPNKSYEKMLILLSLCELFTSFAYLLETFSLSEFFVST